MLENKTALIYGAGGAVGGAVATTFAREGAKVFLAGRTLEPVEAVAKEIAADGGAAGADQVDALDEASVERHAAAVAEREGGIDISFNAIAIRQDGIQGTPLIDLTPDKFELPVTSYALSHFLTARGGPPHGRGRVRCDPDPHRHASPDGRTACRPAWPPRGQRSKRYNAPWRLN